MVDGEVILLIEDGRNSNTARREEDPRDGDETF